MFEFKESINFAGNERIDVLSVGEVLVDFISKDIVASFKKAESFDRYFGGSPANIAMNLIKLGAKSALISKVGKDGLGDYLLTRLRDRGVNTEGIIQDKDYNTTIIMVTKSQASPKFLAYRDADKNLTPDEVVGNLVTDAKLVHLSTFALSGLKSRQALLKTVEIAKANGKLVSLDPNYRPQLWEGADNGVEVIINLLGKIDIVKPSIDDAQALFGENDAEGYIEKFHQAGVGLVILTMGANGVKVSNGEKIITLESFADEVVDTTGAGDAFWSGLYASLVAGDNLELAVKVGNATAALALKEVGALTNLPNKKQVIKKFALK